MINIGIDLDEILADYLNALINYHNTTYSTSFSRDHFQSYRFWETWGGTRDEAVQKVYDFYKTPHFTDIEPVVGSKNAIQLLKQNHNLHIITSRQDSVAEPTRKWIGQHFPETFSSITFTNHYAQDGETRSKREVCDALDINIFIDDSIEYACDCLTPDRKIFLFDCPWNRSDNLPSEILRVSSWEDIISKLK